MPLDSLEEIFCSDAVKPLLGEKQVSTTYGPLLDALSQRHPFLADSHKGAIASWKAETKAQTVRDILFLERLRELDKLFKQENIKAIILKGPALAYRYYSNPVFRTYGDIDLLVSKKDWNKVQSLLVLHNAKPMEEGSWVGSKFRRVFHYYEVTIDLHYDMLTGRPVERLFEEYTREVKIPGIEWFQELEPHLLFVYLSGHGAFQHLFDEVIWMLDLDLLARNEKSLDWNRVLELSKKFRLKKAVRLTIFLLKDHFQTPIPKMYLGNPILNRFYSFYLSPERTLLHHHKKPRALYLFLKALLRDSWKEILYYGLSRTFQRKSELH